MPTEPKQQAEERPRRIGSKKYRNDSRKKKAALLRQVRGSR